MAILSFAIIIIIIAIISLEAIAMPLKVIFIKTDIAIIHTVNMKILHAHHTPL